MGIIDRKKRERIKKSKVIMNAARRSLYEKGYNSTTMVDIAEAAEYSPGAIYLYFSNKNQLFQSLALEVFQNIQTGLFHIPQCDCPSPFEEVMKEINAMLVDTYNNDPKTMVMALNMLAGTSYEQKKDSMHVKLVAALHDTIGQIACHIEQRRIKTNFTLQPYLLAKIIWSKFTGWVLLNVSLNTCEQEFEYSPIDDFRWWFPYGLQTPIKKQTTENNALQSAMTDDIEHKKIAVCAN